MVLVQRDFAPQGTFDDIQRHFWSSSTDGTIGIQWIEISEAVKQPQCPFSHNKELANPKCHGTETEKTCAR
jgi:hypothetical protein